MRGLNKKDATTDQSSVTEPSPRPLIPDPICWAVTDPENAQHIHEMVDRVEKRYPGIKYQEKLQTNAIRKNFALDMRSSSFSCKALHHHWDKYTFVLVKNEHDILQKGIRWLELFQKICIVKDTLKKIFFVGYSYYWTLLSVCHILHVKKSIDDKYKEVFAAYCQIEYVHCSGDKGWAYLLILRIRSTRYLDVNSFAVCEHLLFGSLYFQVRVGW